MRGLDAAPGDPAAIDLVLVDLLGWLDAADYDFATPTLSTVRRWLARPAPARVDARDVLGWGFPFEAAAIDDELLRRLEAAGAIIRQGSRLRSALRAARVEGRLFLHSAYPGAGDDAVFVGPDSYRFARLIRAEAGQARSILDVGTGAGIGAILAGAWSPGARVSASDVNPAALRLARANAAHAGLDVVFRLAEGLSAAPADLDLIVANPPYVAGKSGRTYKDGGGDLGEGLSLAWAEAALGRLAPGGRLVLYTGSPIRAGGRDVIRQALADMARNTGCSLDYGELDPDIFAGELGRAPYAEVERIAAVGAVMRRPLRP